MLFHLFNLKRWFIWRYWINCARYTW